MQHVRVRVPASTSNLGPGYDCLGAALRLYNYVTLSRAAGEPVLPIVEESADAFFAGIKRKPFPFSCAIAGEIPRSRGLGSSASVRIGVLHGLNALSGEQLDAAQLFEIAARLEGHPDNAAPASFGGFTVARGIEVQRFTVSPRLRFILLVPELAVSTEKARALLPKTIAHKDAVRSANNAAAIVAAFASKAYPRLRGCFADAFHQPHRKKLVRFLDAVIDAADNAGALGAFLSGSGSTMCALALDNAEKIGAAMFRAAQLQNARVIVTQADNRGARVLHQTSNIKHQT